MMITNQSAFMVKVSSYYFILQYIQSTIYTNTKLLYDVSFLYFYIFTYSLINHYFYFILFHLYKEMEKKKFYIRNFFCIFIVKFLLFINNIYVFYVEIYFIKFLNSFSVYWIIHKVQVHVLIIESLYFHINRDHEYTEKLKIYKFLFIKFNRKNQDCSKKTVEIMR